MTRTKTSPLVGKPNWANKTIWTGDNLYVMRGRNSASVDLIYLDPPFNSKTDYAAPIGSQAAGAAFKDTWTLTDIDVEWINLIEQKHPALYRVLLAAMTKSDKSYLVYMAARLLEMKRLLKPKGSIYLHCDPTMSHYLKLAMDAIFGQRNFRNELSWLRSNPKSHGTTNFPNCRDIILRFAKSDDCTFNHVFGEHDPEYVRKAYKYREPSGRRYRLLPLLNPNNDRPNLTYEFLGVTRVWRWTRERMEQSYRDGIVVQLKPGAVPQYKKYLDESKGRTITNDWGDIDQAAGNESIGYPTQKPLALLKRIILASSDKDDIVLDPFCGCATTCVAADDLDRNWIGIDISKKAAELVVERIEQRQGLYRDIVHRTDIPERNDIGRIRRYNSPTNKKHLYGDQGGYCAGCSEHFQQQHLEVDHIISKKKGGTDHLDNLQLLCTSCNRRKGDRGMAYLQSRLQLAA